MSLEAFAKLVDYGTKVAALKTMADVLDACITVVGLLALVYGIECLCSAVYTQRRLSTITRAELDAAFLRHRARERVLFLGMFAATGLALAVLFVAFVWAVWKGSS
jgi:hypothetical protein